MSLCSLEPEGVSAPQISNPTPHTLDMMWVTPTRVNGIIVEYKIYENGTQRDTVSVDGNMTTMRVDDLIPYTLYTYAVAACTIAGCTLSSSSAPVRTTKAFAEGIPAPSLVSKTPTSVFLKWTPPQLPNGDILQYSIQRRLQARHSLPL
ncbi:hypothetical protein NP493_644g03013 [Ridgeia piscesae]|uniref:Fibronectin type-III domain-containing protein n=1 Tax=Ridgeia piscesae TaxID=27915 RepID=A0AAD9NNN3_RIDPI|nr:hypothetical protein NP493_644g03013 [Ridgeia piscesae]